MVNVEVGEPKTQPLTYPRLMVSIDSGTYSGRVVFMLSDKCGVLLKRSGDDDYLEVGYIGVDWNMDAFADFNFPVTLENA